MYAIFGGLFFHRRFPQVVEKFFGIFFHFPKTALNPLFFVENPVDSVEKAPL